ncbi:MAG: T9SS type A sorting domain-containing protein, partial [Bacteroidaceae bacterium]|nr:T9SS type A sorting domain-containing protein [Bacteroidaceae bacterium]
YDTHKYAGLNAYFGDYDNAQEFTILPATAYSEEETNSSVGKDKTPKGYVIATAEKVTSGTFSKYYKLDTQRGTDVALDPYQADVDWLFYEATFNNSLEAELAAAKEAYKFDTDGVVTGTAPGFYNSDNIAAYSAAYAAAAALTPESPKADVRKAIDALADAYAKAIVVNPIVEGYYAIVSAGKGSGHPFSNTVKYDDEDRYALYNSNGIVSWKTYDESAYDEIYYFSQSADGNWYVKSLIDNTYMNRGTGSYNCKITTSAEAVTSQEFIASDVAGKFIAKFNGNPYVYALTSSHNGSGGNTTGTLNIWGSAAEANQGKMNLWYLRSVSDETVTRAKESIVAGIDDLIAEIEGKNLEGSTLPGYYSQANVDALATALAAAKNLGESTVDEKLSAINTLKAGYNKTLTELNPITEGYYYMVSKYKAFNDKFGSPAAMYIAPGQQLTSGFYAARYEVFDENNANFIFKLTPKDGVADGFYAQSAYCGKYLNTGDGNSWYGEVTNASDAAVNAQLFKNYALGQYWVADETDTSVSRCVRKNGTNNGTIYGWTQIGDVVSEADAGYNAWELIPVTAEDVSAIIEAQKGKDESASRKFGELTDYVNEIQGTYDSYTSDASELSSALKDALKAAYKQFTDARSARPYDITSTDATYQAIQSNLQELMATARLELSGVDGIAAGGNSTVNATNGGVAVTAEADMTLNIFNASGVLVTKQSLKAGDSVNVSLAPGVYVVNGKKMLVK